MFTVRSLLAPTCSAVSQQQQSIHNIAPVHLRRKVGEFFRADTKFVYRGANKKLCVRLRRLGRYQQESASLIFNRAVK